ncbi:MULTISPECIES: ABC transporter permease [Streptomyces]|uniref:FtsX-like permease family protein n=1 Tax=Streptomyces edwardsiae TaxID=3075527 RepID=A0ABU2QCB4_9ACTN|nr:MULTISPECIES: FtsX-like permease family protein [unclassified Streptomyces]MDT0400605.1 FtsX-like permease family protein [Streptomyces sp. DSM 41635]
MSGRTSGTQWARDLAMGTRFAFSGGREGWIRALLTAVGVGLGVALLLLTTALPGALAERDRRGDARLDYTYSAETPEKADDTLVISDLDTDYRDQEVRGRLVQPEGDKAPLPPGLREYPAPGEMVVSPALKELLDSDGGRLLRERLPYDVVGTIGEQGLIGSRELAYYAGVDDLAPHIDNALTARIDAFGNPNPMEQETDPVLVLLVLVVFVVLLMPVAVFIAAAVRFGGERRDRRLAALRLVGSDSRMTRRIAAGEALAGALLGLVFGTGFFLAGREAAASVEVFGISVFPSYLNPSPLLALLVAVAVPAAAVLVTLFALRGVVIEPLGVVRTARPARRRLWWRLLLPLAGVGLLLPMIGQGRDGGDFNQYLVVSGVMCLLVGITALLPWIVEAVVARLGAGSLSWQLAVRRLQLSSGAAARMVNGIAVAVAGAIALQMLFAGVDGDYTKSTGYDTTRAQMQMQVPEGTDMASTAAKFEKTKGVREVYALSEGYLADEPWKDEPERGAQLTIGGCSALREVAKLPRCEDGDVFTVSGGEYDTDTPALSKPGRKLYLETTVPGGDRGEDVVWTLPKILTPADSVDDPTGSKRGGFLMTPASVPPAVEREVRGQLYLALDESVPDAREHVRNTAAEIDPMSQPMTWSATERSERFDSIRTGLFAGAVAVLALIGASLLVSQLEQLRERRKLLSALVAFGTRRRTLSLSVLWQTAIPIGLGLLLAATVGTTLGTVLLRMTSTPVTVDWTSVLQMTGIGAGVVLAVTLLSLPPLLRMMRPDGLRTE